MGCVCVYLPKMELCYHWENQFGLNPFGRGRELIVNNTTH